jgi:NADH:ubiquinone oxidoreductase subunit C
MSIDAPNILDRGVLAGDEWITVSRENVRETLSALKAQGFESYLFMTCVDHLATPVLSKPPERYELVYQLRDMPGHREIRVRVFLPETRRPPARTTSTRPRTGTSGRRTTCSGSRSADTRT